MKKASSYIAAVCAVIVLLLAGAHVSMAVTCAPTELRPCTSAITSSAAPTRQCCNKIKEQKPCLCQYIKNPYLKRFVNSPNARKVSRTCGVPFPKC